MSAPLISDATLAKIMRLALDCSTPDALAALLELLVADAYAGALDLAREGGFNGDCIAAIEEANEEAARTYDAHVR